MLIAERGVGEVRADHGDARILHRDTRVLIFPDPLYLVLIFKDKAGLFGVPTVAFLWLISSWPSLLPCSRSRVWLFEVRAAIANSSRPRRLTTGLKLKLGRA